MDMSEIKSLVEAQGTAFEEFKKTNDALIKAKADGKSVVDLEAKLATLNTAMDKFGDLKTSLEEVEKKLARPDLGDQKEIGAEVKAFNVFRKAVKQSDLSIDQYDAYRKAHTNYVRAAGNVDMMTDEERKTMSAGSSPDGGYFVPAAQVGRIVSKVYELSPIRSVAGAITISGLALEGVYDNDEASYGWTSELGARTVTTTPQIGQYRIEAGEQYANPDVSQQLLDDAAVDIEAWLAGKVSNKFARAEAAAFITGTGIGQPRGFTTYTAVATGDATRAWGQMEIVKTGVSSDFAASNPGDNLFDLIQAFKTAYLQNANWVTTRAVIAKVRKFKEATTNAYMWQPGLAKGTPDTLLGYPIVIAQDMPVLAAGSLSMALGDFREGYQIVDRAGIRTLRDPYTAKPKVLFYSTRRVGGAVLNFEAIKFIYFGT